MDDRTIPLQARRLTKTFGNRTVLCRLDLAVAEGQSIALTGSNGAGKTTLLGCLAGLARPTDGQVLWFGQPAAAEPSTRRLLGLAAHESFLYPALSPRENLVFAARMHGIPRPAQRAEELIAGAGLLVHADRPCGRLSRGMRQKLAVLRALVHDPPIVLLDEPFSGVDAEGTAWLMRLLEGLRARGRAICFATHDYQAAAALADRVLHLRAGRLEEVNLAGAVPAPAPARAQAA